jgi:ABC-2 type transport system permease protein
VAFLRKEFTAIFKTYRFWVIPVVLFFFSVMSPAMAKLTPQILDAAMPKGMAIKMPAPQLTDAFAQWFKNLSQIGVLAIILLTMGIVAEEKTSGTILLIVTKPVSRANVILSKFFAQSTWLGISFIAAAAICYVYAAVIFKFQKLAEFAQANVLYLMYFILVVAVTIFFSAVMKNQIAAGGLTLIATMGISIVAALSPTFDKYAPTGLTTVGLKLALGQKGAELSRSAWPAAITVLCIAALLAISIVIFNREEL